MNVGSLPPALLCAALGLALAFAPRRALAPAFAALVVTALPFARLSFYPAWSSAIVLGGWMAVLLTAALVYLPGRIGLRTAVLLGLNAGVWSGAITGLGGGWLELWKALPWALLALPGAWAVARGGRIGVQVLASWLIAVAILAAALPMITTPAYAPDHMS